MPARVGNRFIDARYLKKAQAYVKMKESYNERVRI